MQHCQSRSDRIRIKETTPVPSLQAPAPPTLSPGRGEDHASLHHPRSKGRRAAFRKLSPSDLQEAHLGRRFQGNSGSLPCYRLAPDLALEQLDRRSLDAKAPLEHIALEGETTKLREVPPPTPEQLDRDKLELGNDSWTYKIQLADAIEAMQRAVHSLVAKLDGQQGPTSNDDKTATTTTTTTTTTTIPPTQPIPTTITTTTTTTAAAVESLA